MTKIRLIFYAVFAAFHLGAFIFTLFINSLLNHIFKIMWSFKWVTFFGLVLLIIDFVWSLKANSDSKKEKDAITHELNMLKARLYDIQEGKDSPSPKPTQPKV